MSWPNVEKVVGHFKHRPASAAELEQKQIEHEQKKESLIQSTTHSNQMEFDSGHDKKVSAE